MAFQLSSEDVVRGAFIGVVAAAIWAVCLNRFFSPSALICPHRDRWPLVAALVSCTVILAAVLNQYAAREVRSDTRNVAFYLVLGTAWVAMMLKSLEMFGMWVLADTVERRNPAARWAACGAMVGFTLCFAGGNIGEGPGPQAVIASAGLASLGLWLVLLIVQASADLVHIVTDNRDQAAGFRMGALLVATGLIMGRAVAGNWVSLRQTGIDWLHDGNSVLILAAADVLVTRLSRPTRTRPQADLLKAGVLPALVYLSTAALIVYHLGAWK